MEISIIEEKVINLLEKSNLKLYSIKEKNEFGARILEILIDETSLSHDITDKITETLIDEISDYLADDIFLEVSGVGAERPLNNLLEIKNNLEEYVYLISDYYKGYGYIAKVENNIITLKVFIKARMVKKEIPYEKISLIRKAVKV